MSTRTTLAAIAAATFALLPAAALADLQVNANGFERVVTSSTQGDTCDVQPAAGGVNVDCPDGTRGTMLFYRQDGEGPVCEVDFWYGLGNSGAQEWRAIVPRQNAFYGNCALHWPYANVLQVTLSPSR